METESTFNTIMCMSIASSIVSFGVMIFLAILASRFVTAFESMAKSLARLAGQNEKQATQSIPQQSS